MKDFFAWIRTALLSDAALEIRTVLGNAVTLRVSAVEETEDTVVCRYEDGGQAVTATVTARGSGDAVVLRIDARTEILFTSTSGFPRAFTPERAVRMKLGPLAPEAILASRHDNAWWMYPAFLSSFAGVPDHSQSLLIRAGGRHIHLLPLCGDNIQCEFDGEGLFLSTQMNGLYELHGDFLAVAAADAPYEAIDKNYASARRLGAIRVPLFGERTLPAAFEGLGFCTWDAFYRNVSAENVYKKLDEFREKKIPVRFLLLDDGWYRTRDSMMTAFEEDRAKFPEGLRAFVRRVKEEYGIPYVGVWQTMNGYWHGIDPESRLFEEQKENLTLVPLGYWIPSVDDEERAFRFWDSWHSYLSSCGINFLKVDNQSSHLTHTIGVMPTAEACRIAHNALERSVNKYFAGAIINCMGMEMTDTLARPSSCVARNSDDFYPGREDGFSKHLIQNVYNAVCHGEIMRCDFDMWWSGDASAEESGVLRAISGSPVYVSDQIGKSSAEMLLRVVDDDGSVMYCDGAARPTTDCLYVDCRAARKLQKVWNKSGDAFAVAAFSVTSSDCTDEISFGTVPAMDPGRAYVAYEYFTQTYLPVTSETLLRVTLPPKGVRVWSVYPVLEGEDGKYIEMGDPSKFVPIASGHKTRRLLSEIFG